MHYAIRPRCHSFDQSPRVIMLIMANAVDCDSFALWCRQELNCQIVESSDDLQQGLNRCRSLRPRLLVIDPSIAADAFRMAADLVRAKDVHHLLVLGQRPQELHVAEMLAEPATSYFCRTAGTASLSAAMNVMLSEGRRMFDPTMENRIRRTPRGYRLQRTADVRSVAMLSRREREVMRHLAEGRSVRECAAELGLSESTIDNHKSRLMKKLGVHKATELTRWALRDGLIPL